jgi:SAM-dependent methyltransferase
MKRIIKGDLERAAWNREYGEKAPEGGNNERLSRKLNKKEVFESLTGNYNFEGKKILDIGTGNGEYALTLAQKCRVERIVAVDFSETAVRTAEERRKKSGLINCIFIVADVHHLPFKENYFDIATIINVLHHLPAPQKTLREVSRLTNKFVLFEKNKLNPYEWLCRIRRRGRYPSDPSFFIWELKRLIRNGGFDIETLAFYQFVPYTIYNFRLLKKFFRKDRFIKGLLHLSRVLQKVPVIRCLSLVVMATGKKSLRYKAPGISRL